MTSHRYLTKSNFKIATECPTKLYYTGNNEYANRKSDDPFLEGLAEGGFQVAELAKYYYRKLNPVDLNDVNTEEAIKKTSLSLLQDHVVIFEAAILYDNLLIRSDILVKNNNSLRLIEVKSSSLDPTEKPLFMTKKGGIQSDWKPYILDVAFQKFVLQKAFPNYVISSYLMLLDKTARCPADGLNQKFKILKAKNGRTKIVTSPNITEDDLSPMILKEFNIDDEVKYIYEKEKYRNEMTFEQYIYYLADMYIREEKIRPIPGAVCGKCEFKVDTLDSSDLNSGFKDCWSEVCGFHENDFELPTTLDLWYYPNKDKLIHNGIYHLTQIQLEDINPKSDNKPGLSRSERQWLQVTRAQNNNLEYDIDKNGLRAEVEKWIYPLHFIDFETAMPAIPLNKGAYPYQGFAFQFSHHVLHKDGKVEHVDQFINTEIGVNPNLSFIKALMKSLNNDNGTIFRYHNHENTYLNIIYQQIIASIEYIEDKESIIKFIQSITAPTKDSTNVWEKTSRCMVDLCNLVARYTYDPLTMGKTSIKKVFPAILQRSSFLKNKYSYPIYGNINGIRSLNFKDMQWIQVTDGKISDPYDLLGSLLPDMAINDDEIELLFPEANIKGGGIASIAYLRMQFSEMSDIERNALVKSLLKYCELDTLAMVMLVEAWLDMLG